MSATSLAHTCFVGALEHFARFGATRNERDLAQLALDLYSLAPTHPLVVHYVNQFSLKALAA